MHRATVEKIIKSIGAWLLNMGLLTAWMITVAVLRWGCCPLPSPIWSSGEDPWFSPRWPGFNSRYGNAAFKDRRPETHGSLDQGTLKYDGVLPPISPWPNVLFACSCLVCKYTTPPLCVLIRLFLLVGQPWPDLTWLSSHVRQMMAVWRAKKLVWYHCSQTQLSNVSDEEQDSR